MTRPLHTVGGALILATALLFATAIPSYADWVVNRSTASASSSAGTISVTQSGFAGLATTYSASSTMIATSVTVQNTGTLSGTFSSSAALASGSNATIAAKTAVKVWPQTTGNPCTSPAPASALSGTWASVPALSGSLSGGASVTYCILTTLPAADQTVVASVAPTLSVKLAGTGSWTSTALTPVTQSVADLTAPSIPTGLAASSTVARGTTLTWNASSDVVGVTGYRVYRNTTGTTTYTLLATVGSTTTFTDSGLDPSKTYYYTVAAIDGAGNESTKSAQVAVTTPAPTSPTSWYRILNDNSGKCLDVFGEQTTDSTDLIIWPCHGHNNQQFQLQPVTGGFKVIPRHAPGLAWALPQVASTTAGTQVLMRTYSAADRWYWTVVPVPGTNSYQFKSVRSGMCLSLDDASSTDGALLEQRACASTNPTLTAPEQTFTLVLAG
ncbi:RICIN domain-containing protein [Leifsonia sp. YIM 134122]|uniref:RICIN domain-containing protein n=1 Tax=Leifsonia stereocauli TaxID=3134136 RepID=A0ABU9W562_9MICO